MPRVVLTGVGGFVGHHCLEYFLANTNWHIVGIDSFRHKGTVSRLVSIKNYDPSRVTILKHDLSVPIDEALQNQIVGRNFKTSESVDIIISMASDSAVERSVTDPVQCWRNNCELGINMLELARKIHPRLFFNIGTDEVYGECTGAPHKEWDVILPSNPYAASKAAQEALCISYWRTYKMPIVLINGMNMIGEAQDKEKFLPKLIWKIVTGQTMEIYGEPGSIGSRFYLHAKNMADAIIFLSNKVPAMYPLTERPDRYNIVGDVELNNLEVGEMVAGLLDKKLLYKLIPSESARPGYDKKYALDGKKMADLGWRLPIPTTAAFEKIIQWSLANPHWIV